MLERVTALRSHHHIPVHRPADDGVEPWLISAMLRVLYISAKTLRVLAEAGEIDAIHPLPDGPWILSHDSLATTHPARTV